MNEQECGVPTWQIFWFRVTSRCIVLPASRTGTPERPRLMVTTVSNRARSTAAALGLDVDAILAQHDGRILSVKDVEAFAERSLPQAAVRTQAAPPPTASTPKPTATRRPASRPAASRATPPESEDPLLLDGCRLEIMWPQSRVGKVRRRVGMVRYLPPAQQSADQREHRAYLCLLERRRGGAPRERRLFGRTLLARHYEAR